MPSTKKAPPAQRPPGRTEPSLALEWKFQPGQELRYKLTQINEVSGDAARRWSEPARNEVSLVVRLHVTKVDERGAASVRITFDRISYKKGSIREQYGYLEYDSEIDTQTPEGQSLPGVKGKS